MVRRGSVGLAILLATNVAVLAETPLERGDYLVNGLLTCGNCHTPRGPGGVFDMSKQLSGGPQVFDEPSFTVKGANITPDSETGLGRYSEADIRRVLLEGKRPNGTQLADVMPYAFYKVFTPGDLDAVVAYVRSVPSVKNKVQLPIYKGEMHPITPPGTEKPMSEADQRDPLRHGFYLVTVAHCMECHTPNPGGRLDVAQLGKGGRKFEGPWGVVTSRNITSHKEKGVGAWNDAEIKRAITQGVRKDGTRLKGPMAFPLYARMTDADLSAVVSYLRTVPPKD